MTARDEGRPGAVLREIAYYLVLAVGTFVGAVWATGLFARSWVLPLFYRTDALSGGAQFKGTLENGWYEYNPALGAPYGQNMHPFPLADNLQFALARVLGWFTDQWSVAYNTAYLLTYPAAAVAAAWFLRRFGVSRVTAFAVGTLFAFAPYHFMHGLPHLSLSMYFTVPLVVSLSVATMVGLPLWRRREGVRARNPLAWLTPTTLGTLAIVAVSGSTSSYYAVFGGLFLGVAAVVALLRRQVAAAVGAVVAGVALVGVMLLNMAPDILWARSHLASPGDFGREPLEAEVYALKFAGLVFPTHWNRIGGLGEFRFHYDATFPLPGEGAALGMVAAAGFVVLLAVPLVLLARGRRESGWWPSPLVSTLSLFTWIAFAFGTVGGLATLFAVLVTPDIRAWNRIVTFIMLFSLAGVALAIDGAGRWSRRRWSASAAPGSTAPGGTAPASTGSGGAGSAPRALRTRATAVASASAVLAVAVLAFGLFDQVAPRTWALTGDEQARWDADAAYVADIEERMPAGTMIFELPASGYPESPTLHELEDYELMRPYLHSTDLRWSYGAVKGRPSGDWTLNAQSLPPDELVVALVSAGFTGVHVDRFGYAGRDASAIEGPLAEMTGAAPLTGADDRYAFYDLTERAAEVRDDYPRWFRDRLASHLTNPVLHYWQRDFWAPAPGPDGRTVMQGTANDESLQIVNARREPTEMIASFGLRADGATEPTPVTVHWPDGQVDTYDVGPEGREVKRRLMIPRGASDIRMTAGGVPTISLVETAFTDPVLDFTTVAEREAQRQDGRDRARQQADGSTSEGGTP